MSGAADWENAAEARADNQGPSTDADAGSGAGVARSRVHSSDRYAKSKPNSFASDLYTHPNSLAASQAITVGDGLPASHRPTDHSANCPFHKRANHSTGQSYAHVCAFVVPQSPFTGPLTHRRGGRLGGGDHP